MDDDKNSGGNAVTTYNRLMCQEDMGTDEQQLYSDQERTQVTMSTRRAESTLNPHKVLAIGLAVLAVLLLAADIGLGVYYNKLTGGYLITDISSEISRLQDSYTKVVESREEAKKTLAKEISQQQITKWELEHQLRRSRDYQGQIDQSQEQIAKLKSHIPLIKEGCRHCQPGWTFMNSMCYFFAVSEDLPSRSWSSARQFCKKYDSDLIKMDSRDKQLAVIEWVVHFHDTSRSFYQNGFWLGLSDAEQEGTWIWTDGTRLSEGYWKDGEPNNQNNEDCAAVYPSRNPFKSWNDAPCSHSLKWICERAPRVVG